MSATTVAGESRRGIDAPSVVFVESEVAPVL